jgi:dCMP deaminase
MYPDAILQAMMRRAYLEALNSTDRSTRNGAALYNDDGDRLAVGCNRHLFGYGHKEAHHERPLKYSLTEHAERSVILQAAANGIMTGGLTMVANWVACPDCARAIILAGVERVICHKQCMDRTPPRWTDMVRLGLDMLSYSNVEVVQWDGKVGDIENLNCGEIWYP